jgi:hypothetical protein
MMVVQDDEASDVSVLFLTTTKVGEALSPQQAQQRFEVASGPGEPADSLPVLPIEPPETPLAPPVSRAQVLSWIQTKTPLAGKDLTGVDLSAADLRGADFSGCVLPGARLEGARLEGANLSGAVLSRVRATGACFDACDLSGADLADAILVNATFRKARMAEANLWTCRLPVGCSPRRSWLAAPSNALRSPRGTSPSVSSGRRAGTAPSSTTRGSMGPRAIAAPSTGRR